jgi:hypothetical protein
MDLVELTPAYNGAMYAFYIIKNYNLINKWEARKKLNKFREWIRTQFGYNIAIIHINGETALVPLFKRY